MCSSQALSAANFSYTGSFFNNSDVQFFDFSLAADSNSVLIDSLSLNGVGGFANDYYWSSSELSMSNMWVQAFDTGYPGYNAKGHAFLVRAVRAF